MAPSRRNSNGRSPLVNPQRQITSFFSKSTSPSPSPSPSLTLSKPIPNPNPSPTPPTPSPLNPKPLLLIGASPSPSSSSSLYGQVVVGRRIKVYWPLDKAWYEGFVKSFDNLTSKHLVHYDDDEEESIDLSKEKIEWPQENSSSKKLKRLRRGVPAVRKMVIEDDDEEEKASPKEEDNDDSDDDDWGKNAAIEDAVDGDEEDTDLENQDNVEERPKGKSNGKVEPKKRRLNGTEKLEPAKKSKSGGEVGKGAFKPTSTLEIKKTSNDADNVATAEPSERFASREAQKFRFLREDRRDSKRRRPGDVNYDSRTLYLPPDFLRSLSDGQKQWWEFKSKHMDKVLFFKV